MTGVRGVLDGLYVKGGFVLPTLKGLPARAGAACSYPVLPLRVGVREGAKERTSTAHDRVLCLMEISTLLFGR